MSVRLKMVVIIMFVALVPLSVSAATMLGLHQRAFEQKLFDLHAKSAQYGAEAVESSLGAAVSSLRPLIVSSIRWPDLTTEERDGALWLVYGQLAAVTAVWVMDVSHRLVQSAAYLPAQEAERDSSRVAIEPSDLPRLIAASPTAAALEHGIAFGDVSALGPERTPILPIAFPVSGPKGERWFVGVALSLLETCAELIAKLPEGTSVHLLDARGRFVCRHEAFLQQAPAALTSATQARGGFRYVRADGAKMLAAAASAPWGFKVLAEQSEQDALAASRQMRNDSALLIAVGAIAAIVAGLLLARSIHGPVRQLVHGAEQVARGNFDVRLNVQGDDELAELSHTFNRMSTEIAKRDKEIRAWNEELRQRVEQRTSELKETQAALLESRKIAAVASLGAGVAHEINNPLTGVIGLTQLLKSKIREPKDNELLAAIEREALRIRDIVQRMQSLSLADEQRGYSSIAPNEILDKLLAEFGPSFERGAISVERQHGANGHRVHGNSAELEQALHEVIDNAVKAMRGRSGRLTVSTECVEDELYRLKISDTGHGIAPADLKRVFEPFFTTKGDWQGKGLGLTMAYRVIEAHQGTIRLQSTVGEGTSVTITLPIARRGSHLL